MTIEQLARFLAARYGYSLDYRQLHVEMRQAGMECTMQSRERLMGMVDNITDQAFRLWDLNEENK